uniref:P-type domain-containing protein n=1 Tax=Parascaris univalens TaxID=6257 RepID=A0A915AGP4_PARUN
MRTNTRRFAQYVHRRKRYLHMRLVPRRSRVAPICQVPYSHIMHTNKMHIICSFTDAEKYCNLDLKHRNFHFFRTFNAHLI